MSQPTHEIIQDIRRRAKRRDPRAPVRHWLRRRSWDADPSSFFRELAEVLAEQERTVISFLLPRDSLDAGEHILGQLCQAFGVSRLPRASFSVNYPLHKRIAWIARPIGLENSAPLLLLDIPRGWLVRLWDPRRTLPDGPRAILEALLRSGFDAVVISDRDPPWLGSLMSKRAPEGELPVRPAPADYLLDESRWGTARDEARHLGRALGSAASASGISSTALELGVACCALGRRPEDIAAILHREEPSQPLLDVLKVEMKQRPDWQPAIRRLSLPRFPIPHAVQNALSGPMEDGQRMLIDCLTHSHQGEAHASAVLRALVVDKHCGEPEAHARLSEHYRTLDGARTAKEAIDAGRIVPWLERIHHLGHQGPAGLPSLEQITPLSRMSRYELAWSLSVEFKEYEIASGIYRQLAEENPGDAYSHHYWAWNLDQAGKDLQTVWQEYKKAIRLDPENPWYNSRYITFLRDNGFQRDAREAWREAHPIVCASRWAKMPDFPDQFHRWVARSALDAGDLVFAREVLASLPAREITASPKLCALVQELEHLSEVERLGEPIYPLCVPIKKRWNSRLLLPSEYRLPDDSTAKLVAYYPGRVIAVENDVITVLLADPTEVLVGDAVRRLGGDLPQDPPVLSTTEIPRGRMVEIANGILPEVGRFLELGIYEGDRMLCRYHPREPNVMSRGSFDHSIRFLYEDVTED